MTVRFEMQGPVAVITLDAAGTKNAITNDMRRELWEAFERCALDEAVRCVVLTGAHGDFCSGMDVRGMGRGGVVGSMDRMHTLNRIARAIHHLKKPTVAAVPGVCVGVGWSYALACDLVLASDQARFAAIFRNIGLAPDGGLVWHLRRLLGVQRAKEIVFSGRMIRAEEALALGLVLETMPQDDLMERALAQAQALAAGPTIALGLAKRQFDLAHNLAFDQYLDAEATMQPIASRTVDHEEGLAAFRDRRKPEFRGE